MVRCTYYRMPIAIQQFFLLFSNFEFPQKSRLFRIDAVDALNALLDRLMKEYSDLILLLARNPTSDQVRLLRDLLRV